MGADLYIKSIQKKTEEKFKPKFDAACLKRDKLVRGTPAYNTAQKSVSRYYDKMYADGYFRDSYNGSGIAGRLNFSWWNYVGPLLDKEGFMSVENMKAFLARIEATNLELPTEKELRENHCTVDKGQNSLAKWHENYVNRKAELVKFLQKAIKLNEPIYCSI
jgi:hypothetical protein